ncbi:MAG: hypothetical protein Fur0018_28270 [Anaerolineales bacterium]
MSAWFLFFLSAFAGLLGLCAWKLFGILTKRQALFAAALLMLAGVTGALWQTSGFLAGIVLLFAGSGLTTTYIERSTTE